jgi:hypothetical protein
VDEVTVSTVPIETDTTSAVIPLTMASFRRIAIFNRRANSRYLQYRQLGKTLDVKLSSVQVNAPEAERPQSTPEVE